MDEKFKIIISGAGLGGLAAAACLLMDGHDVDVYEQAPELGEVGAGIQISANAMHVLNYIGVGILTFMMLLTVSDVLLRFLFNKPILGPLN